MTTLTAVRQNMLAVESTLGRVEAIAALAAQSITVTVLATGTIPATKFTDKWLLRPQAADAANRAPRFSSNFASTTGLITHAGAAYTDTTATGENVEIHEVEPWRLELAIQQALNATRYVDTSDIQGRADGNYTFGLMPWIMQPADILMIGRRGTPVLTGNRQMGAWGLVSTGGALQPDRWTLSGAAGVWTRSTTSRNGLYSLSAQRSGTNLSASQTVIAVTGNDNDAQSLRGMELTGVLVARSTTASQILVRVTSEKADGTVISTSDSAYHTGGGGWEEVSIAHTVSTSADIVRVAAIVEVDGTPLIDDLYLSIGAVETAQRIDRFETDWVRGGKDWSQGPLGWYGPEGITSQVRVCSLRAYPEFDATRLKAGTADLDETDAPLDLITYRALAMLFEGLISAHGSNTFYADRAATYSARGDSLALQHIAASTPQPGAKLYTGAAYGMMARTR